MTARKIVLVCLGILLVFSFLFIRHALNFGSRPEPTQLDLSAELWAHERLIGVKSTPDTVIAPFSTDGCSGGLSAIWSEAATRFDILQSQIGKKPPWERCCVAHDRVYHGGGTAIDPQDSFQQRLDADWALRQCIVKTGENEAILTSPDNEVTAEAIVQAYIVIGDLVYSAVRLAGGPCSGLPWRWGYGFPDCGLSTTGFNELLHAVVPE